MDVKMLEGSNQVAKNKRKRDSQAQLSRKKPTLSDSRPQLEANSEGTKYNYNKK